MNPTSSAFTPPFDLSKNHGPAVSVIAWMLLIISTLSMITRLASKFAFSKKLHSDDFVAIAAWVFDVGAVGAVSVEATSGLGQEIATVSKHNLQRFMKSQYSAELLYLVTIALAKFSIVILLHNISPDIAHQRMSQVLGMVIIIWSVGSFFAAAFQCDTPNVWNTIDGVCYNRVAFWRSVGIMNILTDMALIAIPFYMMWNLNMNLKKRIIVLSCFGSRSFDIVITGAQLAFTGGFDSTNPTESLWKWTIASQFSLCMTIISSCVPYLRPFLETLPSGMYRSDELRRRGIENSYGYIQSDDGTYQLRNAKNASSKGALNSASSNVQKSDALPQSITIDSEFGITDSRQAVGWDAESQESVSNIIRPSHRK